MKYLSFFFALLSLSVPAFASEDFKVEVPSFPVEKNSMIPDTHVFDGFGCSGKNRSPAVTWSNAPGATKSFAVTMYDPDAPTGSGWWHWIVYNIPASATSLAEGAGVARSTTLPRGSLQARNDYGVHAYGGPCPPEGDRPHRYIVTVFALKEKLDVPENASAALIGFQLNKKALATASMTGFYGR